MAQPSTSHAHPPTPYVGRSVDRLEDVPLLTGRGRFADDIVRPGMLHAHTFRSTIAHGRITRLDLTAARTMPGISAVYAAADIAPHVATPRMPLAMPGAAIRHVVEPDILAIDEVTYVGQAIALIIAETRGQAEDAAGAIVCEIEPLAAVPTSVRHSPPMPPAPSDDSPTICWPSSPSATATSMRR